MRKAVGVAIVMALATLAGAAFLLRPLTSYQVGRATKGLYAGEIVYHCYYLGTPRKVVLLDECPLLNPRTIFPR